MKYKVIYGSNESDFLARQELEKEVNKLLNCGWKLQGGVSMMLDNSPLEENSTYIISQAMIKE